ncbi:Hypothetical protein R9X50_00108400 [Acrodontium crateriforme]|uniref:Uncharacterized protein n=1 Tax=Acrodontium crateriforme TaxID=150365 RepID=A0AAQ3LZJ8_9PEZI|nr:Hypothetical protein R9X50_00108400 [Acrodontium crateriforme]
MASNTDEFKMRERTNTSTSVAKSVQSFAGTLLASNPPSGFFAATADAAATAPTLPEIRRGSFGQNSDVSSQRRKRTMSSSASSKKGSQNQGSSGSSKEPRVTDERDGHGMTQAFPALTEEPSAIVREEVEDPESIAPNAHIKGDVKTHEPVNNTIGRKEAELPPTKLGRTYTGGYLPPPVVPWTTSTVIGLKAFWKWFCKPFGFFLTIYGLNVVAWGGMLFLLLCNASQAMCHAPIPTDETRRAIAEQWSPVASLSLVGRSPRFHDCNNLLSPRRIWLEIDSQILNALFCVTGFGLVPWRFRDLWYLLRWRLTSEKRYGREKKLYGLRVLAGIHQNWFRLPGSDTQDEMTRAQYEQSIGKNEAGSNSSSQSALEANSSQLLEDDPRVAIPLSKTPLPPITDIRAPPTALWKLDFFIWCQVLNTVFQCCLCGFMWGMNRYTRPSWATGFFIAVACVIAGVAGFMSFLEGKGIKRVEGASAPHVEAAAAETLDLEPLRPVSRIESVHLSDKDKEAVA